MHPHGEVLTLDIAGADVLGVRVSTDGLHFTSDANCGGVSRLVFEGRTINLMQLSVINIRAECFLYRFQVCFVTVRGDLHTIANPRSAVLHKVRCPVSTASTDQIADYEFRISINSCPFQTSPQPISFFSALTFLAFAPMYAHISSHCRRRTVRLRTFLS